MLPVITGEFGVVKDPDIKFTESGTMWMKIRGAAKDRIRGQNGEFTDGPPLYIDIIVGNGGQGNKATHLAESVLKGDTITVIGKLKLREYEYQGEKRQEYQIDADTVGVSTRYGTAKTTRASNDTQAAVDAVKESLGGEEIPF